MTTGIRERGEEARRFILENVGDHPSDIAKVASEHLKISRQAAHWHLKKFESEGALEAKGKTRSKSYVLPTILRWSKTYPIASGLEEDVVWRNDIAPRLDHLPDSVTRIWQYGFTEMFNNAIDHSDGTVISVYLTRTAVTCELAVADNGIGIFRKIQKALGLIDERHAILELSKGKLTTAPSKHTGEGVFFTSHLFDSFDILSGGLFYTHKFGDTEGWLSECAKPDDGTFVWLKLSNHTARTLNKVMEKFSSGDGDFSFSKTVVPVRLAKYGDEQLISRSQAKRLLARFELFSSVVLDFTGVESIGQAFADQVFRVFESEHPRVKVTPIHATSAVRRMILRAYVGKDADVPSPVRPSV